MSSITSRNKICSASHSLYHLLPPYRTSDLRQRGHPFQLPDHCTDLHKNPCINISNKVILVFSCIALCFYCFMCSLCSTSIVLLCILMCVCRILIKITYLLIYLWARRAVRCTAHGGRVRWPLGHTGSFGQSSAELLCMPINSVQTEFSLMRVNVCTEFLHNRIYL